MTKDQITVTMFGKSISIEHLTMFAKAKEVQEWCKSKEEEAKKESDMCFDEVYVFCPQLHSLGTIVAFPFTDQLSEIWGEAKPLTAYSFLQQMALGARDLPAGKVKTYPSPSHSPSLCDERFIQPHLGFRK